MNCRTFDIFFIFLLFHFFYHQSPRFIAAGSFFRVRKTLWLSDPIKRFMSQYFIGDAENGLTGKMRNGTSIEQNGIPFTRAEYYSRE